MKITSPAQEIGLGLVLIVVAAAGAVALGNVLDHIPLIAAVDSFLYSKINLAPHPAWFDAIVSPFNFNFLPWGGTFIPSFLYFVFAFGFAYIAIRHRKELLWAFLALIVAMTIDAILFKITHAYVMRDRPFLHLPNQLSESAQAIWRSWPTYPSGHVRDLALYSTVLAGYAHELRWPFAILTLWIVFTRIYIGAHYPTDALAGWALGYVVGIGILFLIKPLRAHYLREREQRKQKATPVTAV